MHTLFTYRLASTAKLLTDLLRLRGVSTRVGFPRGMNRAYVRRGLYASEGGGMDGDLWSGWIDIILLLLLFASDVAVAWIYIGLYMHRVYDNLSPVSGWWYRGRPRWPSSDQQSSGMHRPCSRTCSSKCVARLRFAPRCSSLVHS